MFFFSDTKGPVLLLAALPVRKVALPFLVFSPPGCCSTAPCIPCHLPTPQITLCPLMTIILSSAMKVSAWPHWWRKSSPIDCINWCYACPHGKFIADMQVAHMAMKCCTMCSSIALSVHCKRYCPRTEFKESAQAPPLACCCCFMCRSNAHCTLSGCRSEARPCTKFGKSMEAERLAFACC